MFLSKQVNMPTRTRRFAAHFPAPFRLKGVDGLLPVGAYALEEVEELVATRAGPAYRRAGLFMHLAVFSSGRWKIEKVRVDVAEIEAAILEDLDTDHSAAGKGNGRIS